MYRFKIRWDTLDWGDETKLFKRLVDAPSLPRIMADNAENACASGVSGLAFLKVRCVIGLP
jgi:hypothetical protein